MAARPFTHTFETIPWEEAARLLQKGESKNRALSMKRVDTLARSVESRRFYMTHQGVALDPKGNVIDGQHRLAAHVRAKTDFVGLVCKYTDAAYAEQVMAVFDSGRSRSMADGLAIGGQMPAEDSRQMTAVCNVMAGLMVSEAKGMDLQETADFYRLHRDSVRWCVASVPAKRGGSYVRAAFAIAYEVDPAKTAELSAQIDAGVGLPGTAAAAWNKAHADGLLTAGGGRTARRDVALRALRILKAHLDGDDVPKRIYTEPTSLMWFLGKLAAATDAPPPTRLSDFEARILKAIPKEGAWLREIAGVLNTHSSTVRQNLARMEQVGVVTRPERGFYIAA